MSPLCNTSRHGSRLSFLVGRLSYYVYFEIFYSKDLILKIKYLLLHNNLLNILIWICSISLHSFKFRCLIHTWINVFVSVPGFVLGINCSIKWIVHSVRYFLKLKINEQNVNVHYIKRGYFNEKKGKYLKFPSESVIEFLMLNP